MIKGVTLRVLALSLIGWVLVGTQVSAESLQGAFARAYASNPEFLKAQNDFRVFLEDYYQKVIAPWKPDVSLSSQANHAWQENRLAGSSKANYAVSQPVNMSASVSQNVYSGGGDLAQRRAYDEKRIAQKLKITAAEQTMLLNVAKAYLALYANEELVELQQSVVAMRQKDLKAIQVRFDAGDVTRTDVLKIETNLAQAEAELENAIGGRESARATYQRVIGDLPDKLEEPTLPTLPEVKLESLYDEANNRNPDLLQAVADQNAAQHDLDRARAGFMPTITAQASANHGIPRDHSGSTTSSRYSQDLTAGVALKLPIYDKGVTASNSRQASAAYTSARVNSDVQRRAVLEALVSAAQSYKAKRAQVAALKKAMLNAEEALRCFRIEYDNGTKSVQDVLLAEKDLIDSKTNYINTNKEFIQTCYQILQVIGHLTAKDLRLEVAQLDPQDDYDQNVGMFGFDDQDERGSKNATKPGRSSGNIVIKRLPTAKLKVVTADNTGPKVKKEKPLVIPVNATGAKSTENMQAASKIDQLEG